MKLRNILYVTLGAVMASACGNIESSDATGIERSEYDMIMSRTSIRHYTSEPVSLGAVDSILHMAMAAPSAVNKQPWCFMVINKREMLDSISCMASSWKQAARAPLAIVVCGDTDKALEGEAAEFWIQDCSAVSENILLGAHTLGLGAVWCGCYPLKERVDRLSQYLALPPSVVPLSLIVIGHPSEHPQPKRKFDSTAVHYNQW